MKKILLIVTAIVAVSLMGCDSTVNYKAEGEKMAKELDRLCELKDSAAVVAFDDSIHAVEDRIVLRVTPWPSSSSVRPCKRLVIAMLPISPP